jgi:hypothetical protein
MRVYQLDPREGSQILWQDVERTPEGLIIKTDQTRLFAVYLFLDQEQAENAPEIISGTRAE